jgi:hypothetical protein
MKVSKAHRVNNLYLRSRVTYIQVRGIMSFVDEEQMFFITIQTYQNLLI